MQEIFKILAVGAIMASTAHAFARQPYETINTKDGSTYMGHTSQQLLGENSKTVFAIDSAIMVVPVEKVNNIFSEKRDIANFTSEDWKNWFNAHPQFITINSEGNKSVVMHKVTLEGESAPKQAFLLEKSPKNYKFYVIGNYRDTIPDEEIENIIYSTRDFLDLNGVIDEIITVEGDTYVGQICRWSPDYTGLLNEEGTIEMIPNDKIAQKRIKSFNPQQDLIDQIPYLDEVEGDDFRISGIIILRNRRPSNNKKPYYTIWNDSYYGEDNKNMEEVKSIKKKINTKYNPQKDFYVDEGVILANGETLSQISNEVYENKKANFKGFKIPELVIPNSIKKMDNDELELVMKDNGLNNTFYIIPIRKRIIPGSETENYYFTYEDLVNNNINPEESLITKTGNQKLKYKLNYGEYLIYRNNDKTSYLISIE